MFLENTLHASEFGMEIGCEPVAVVKGSLCVSICCIIILFIEGESFIYKGGWVTFL